MSFENTYSPNRTTRSKPTEWHVRPAKTQISLGIHPAWSESSLCAQWVAKDPSFLHADSEDSDQTGRMPRNFWIFAGRTCHFVGFVMRRLSNCILGSNGIPGNCLSTRLSHKFLMLPKSSLLLGWTLCSVISVRANGIEPRHEKTCLCDLRPGKIQICLLSHRS